MELGKIVVHEIKKESDSTTSELIYSEELMSVDENSSELIELLLKSYSSDKLLYSCFV